VEILLRSKEKGAERKAEKEEEGMAEKQRQLCIPKMMQRQFLPGAHDTPGGGGHFGVH
jgi:hypothetical protein